MKKFLLGLLLVVVLGTVGFFTWVKFSWQSGDLPNKLVSSIFPGFGSSASSTFYFQQAAGFHGPRTYLVLFLNNTELRPGGGFIGSYAVVRVENGQPSIEKVEGTEIIDNLSPTVGLMPPRPLAEYLKIKKWQFRDSNWSPDFALSSKNSLERYAAEKGYAAEEIDGVIGVTPTVFEQLLSIVGPITVNGITLDSNNFTEKVEYEVEYGYVDKGVSFSERKKFLDDLSVALRERILATMLTHWAEYLRLVPRMLAEKQIVLYSSYVDEQAFVQNTGFGGTQREVAGDYLQWVDANLGSLKTDSVIDRALSYTIKPSEQGLVAEASMRLRHTGDFTWRSTKYRDYARVYVPRGAKLVSVTGGTEIDKRGKILVESGEENGKQWFGAFVSVAPGKEATLTFAYTLPGAVAEQVAQGTYTLLVQKQVGTVAPQLTLQLGFDKKLKSAEPPESPDRYGDAVYSVGTDLREDRSFRVQLQ